ncbi:MAG: DUF354 domain-containing protein [bacterium]
MKIWIDLANSPQVLFFRPIIPELERQGHTVTITTRYFAQTVGLADRFHLPHTTIAEHGGRHISHIGLALLKRTWKMLKYAKGRGFQLAMSHNSYAQAMAAKLLGIPIATSMDYEHQPANHICFRLARRVVVPECFPDEALERFGAKEHKVGRYHGLKEEIYLSDFKPQSGYPASLGISSEKIIVVLRPPGTWALYHHFENPLFDQVLEHVAKNSDTLLVFLPRIPSQGRAVKSLGYPNILVPETALDGPNLLYYADLVISGGGTMNREAAVLGTPTYSLFRGKLAAADRHLMELGRMRHIDSAEDIASIPVCRKTSSQRMMDSNHLVKEVVQLMLEDSEEREWTKEHIISTPRPW